MQIKELNISGCFLVNLPSFKDERGGFVKTFNIDTLTGSPLEYFNLKEEFYSTSKKNVLRGLHFQKPPSAHNKIVTCTDGKVLDFFVDLRKTSNTYGKHIALTLDSENPQLLYLPKGLAHGFLTLSENATLLYKTDFVYSPKDDQGILWSSIGLELPNNEFIISERDNNFSPLADYKSPF
ncbi:dTDP-4-dehydrorhamnose 3,5-epimerase family protein [Providencia sp. PROV188]|uniref:dTDP-4-dehydrorhamnose 3,5-epimerase family protein n=1 Tax=Providencia sp. PROV188 TaxID=2939731 RepID=UPI0022DE0C3B|nr:dTDP-4-dehydrorhamnose 3,5-epimerase family protein [Providencia sp. PROV188]WBM60743.1 dTDP-4-dehydrorhamnose 3,5-epimerase family protein [Providencia sp. PROV188]